MKAQSGPFPRRLALALLATALLGCGTPPPPPAAGAAAEVRQALAPTGTLRIGVYPGSPTSLVRGPGEGEMRGLAVELGRDMARRLGVSAQVLVFERVPQIVDALKAGSVDMTLTNASPARAREIDFSPTVVQLESGYLVPPGSRIAAIGDVDRAGVRVGVSQGSTSQGVLGRELKAAQLVPAASVVAATQMLRAGQLDAFATNKGILFEMADQLPGARVLEGRWGLEQLAVGVPKGREAGAAWLQAYVAEAGTQVLVRQAATRAGLRGLAAAAP